MDIDIWKAMLERRGYTNVQIHRDGTKIRYTVGNMNGVRGASSFGRMTYRRLRKEIDEVLGYGMEHVVHQCGYPLLKAPVGYSCNEPFHRVEVPLQYVQFFEVLSEPDPKSLLFCPNCGKVLERKNVHRIHDPEADQFSQGKTTT